MGSELYSILPSQYYAARRKQAPEQQLLIAVLHDAFDCVAKHRFAQHTSGRRLYREAREWFFAQNAGWPFSFEWVCSTLELDPNAVRQRLHGMS